MPRKKSRDNQAVIKQQLSPPSTVMKASGIFLMSGNDDIGQHVRPTDKTGSQ